MRLAAAILCIPLGGFHHAIALLYDLPFARLRGSSLPVRWLHAGHQWVVLWRVPPLMSFRDNLAVEGRAMRSVTTARLHPSRALSVLCRHLYRESAYLLSPRLLR